MRRRWWWVLLGLGAVALVAVIVRMRASASARQSTAARDAAAAQDRPVPVQVVAAAQRDVPIWLEGLGTVTAYNTVVVRARVEGRLDAVVFREGQPVHRGDVLAQIDPRPFQIQLRQAEAVVARDRANLALARRTLERSRALLAQNFVAQTDADTAQATVEQLQATVRADEAVSASARLSLDYARVTSPIDGVTGLRQVDVGNVVHANDANGIVVVAQVDPIAVLFTLPQDDLPRVAAQMARGPLPVEVFSRDGEARLAAGELTVIDNLINQATATVRLKAVFPNAERTLWPDQFVTARLLLMTRRNALVVPSASVQRGPQGTFVYVVGADQRAAMRPVQVDRIEGDLALIRDGISPGEQVVSEGQGRLRAGARVQTRAPADDAGDGGVEPGARGGGRRGGRGDGGVGRGGRGDGGRPAREAP